ncbi:hypothetical protein F4809DRAFT_638317 [Biscogniauxia mediterranea]|nr:hypothetical protein F4809DRAFT_638317 [Biscogniauxia mediterranea]
MLYQIILAVIMAAGITLAAPITTPRGMSAAALPGAVVGSQPATHPGLSPLYIAIIVVCSLSAAITIVVTAIKYHDLCCWCCCCCLKKQRQQEEHQQQQQQPGLRHATRRQVEGKRGKPKATPHSGQN